MEKQHTEGTWINSGRDIVSMPSQIKICKIDPVGSILQTKANARLIAAAPILLQEHFSDVPLLERTIECLGEENIGEALSHLRIILSSKNNAIQKATLVEQPVG